jgi:hypothetical protein
MRRLSILSVLCAGVLLAIGSGLRAGSAVPQFVDLFNG